MTRLAPLELNKSLQETIRSLEKDFPSISNERRIVLNELTEFIQNKSDNDEPVNLVFICTHNSRRSHISQIWAQAAAAHYGIQQVHSFSGGTEATALNPRAVKAMQEAGFEIYATDQSSNPTYEVKFSNDAPPLRAYSKKYDANVNPQNGFAAIMTCSHADENCPVVIGMEKRISLPYNDPKDFDGTPLEAAKYAERVREIGREILFAFSKVK